jgi:hypothetical protein
MSSSRTSRLGVFGLVAAALAVAGMAPAHAEMLAQAECQKLDVERKALMVLGVDKYVDKGPDWAKANLTVADLDLVKRYFELFEQLKFRCQEDIGLVEVDEPDTVDGDDAQQAATPGAAPGQAATPRSAPAQAANPGAGAPPPDAGGSGPPVPPKRAKPAGHSSAAAVPAYTGSTSTTTIAPTTWDTNTTSIAKRPRQTAPVQ